MPKRVCSRLSCLQCAAFQFGKADCSAIHCLCILSPFLSITHSRTEGLPCTLQHGMSAQKAFLDGAGMREHSMAAHCAVCPMAHDRAAAKHCMATGNDAFTHQSQPAHVIAGKAGGTAVVTCEASKCWAVPAIVV